MQRSILSACLLAATAALPLAARADVAAATCSVAIDYLRNGNITEQYRKDFVVQEGVPFFDDYSTPLRFKNFGANLVRANGTMTVTIDWFADEGVFHSVGIGTQLVLRGGGNPESTTGSQYFSTSTGIIPGAVSGNHQTNYVLTCRKL